MFSFVQFSLVQFSLVQFSLAQFSLVQFSLVQSQTVEQLMSNLQGELTALLDLLHDSHALFQQTDLSGNTDDEWSTWYADQLLQHPLAAQLGWNTDGEQLANWLEEQFELSTSADVPWTEFLVRRLMAFPQSPGNGSGDEESRQ